MTFLVDGTNGGTFPSWTTATRPASPAVGQMGYNTTTGQFDAYTSNGWVSVATSGNAPVSGPTFSAYLSSTFTVTANTPTKITFQTELWDTNNCYDNATNYRFTPNVAGYYQVNASVYAGAAFCYGLTYIYKNGSNYKQNNATGYSSNNSNGFGTSGLVYCNGTTDYIEIYWLTNITQTVDARQVSTWFDAALVRAA